jgi:hypothetical protein
MPLLQAWWTYGDKLRVKSRHISYTTRAMGILLPMPKALGLTLRTGGA